jgi:predicted dehydrogenase
MIKKIGRRNFIKTSLVAAGAVAGSDAIGEVLGAPAVGNVLGANDQISIGVIGCGGQGRWNMTDFSKQPDARIIALCDVYEGSIKRTLSEKGLGLDPAKVSTCKDFRQVLDRKDIDAVLISTPDHWHALPAIMACQAGKDVYVEKPLALTVREGRMMVEAARKHQRIVQVGTQQRSAKHFARAAEIVRKGDIGRVTRVHAWNHDNMTPDGIGNPPDSDPPAGLDWDLWLGPAPKSPFNQNRFLGNFRWFWDYSGGKVTDWGTHLIDIVHWAMAQDAPSAAAASGQKFFIKDNRETPDTLEVVYDYPGFMLTYSNRVLNGRGHDGYSYGIMFYGTEATLFVDRGGFEVFPETRTADDLTTPRIPALKMRGRDSHTDHVRNFLDCVKSRKLPASDAEIGHRSTTAAHLANIALRTGRKIHWDSQKEQIVGDLEASKMLSKEYRTPWRLPEI